MPHVALTLPASSSRLSNDARSTTPFRNARTCSSSSSASASIGKTSPLTAVSFPPAFSGAPGSSMSDSPDEWSVRAFLLRLRLRPWTKTGRGVVVVPSAGRGARKSRQDRSREEGTSSRAEIDPLTAAVCAGQRRRAEVPLTLSCKKQKLRILRELWHMSLKTRCVWVFGKTH